MLFLYVINNLFTQEQYATLERKYTRVKRVIKEFQQREVDLIHREEFYLQIVQEKDSEFNALVKTLKDRVRILYSSD